MKNRDSKLITGLRLRALCYTLGLFALVVICYHNAHAAVVARNIQTSETAGKVYNPFRHLYEATTETSCRTHYLKHRKHHYLPSRRSFARIFVKSTPTVLSCCFVPEILSAAGSITSVTQSLLRPFYYIHLFLYALY